jgi:hypothetical protein
MNEFHQKVKEDGSIWHGCLSVISHLKIAFLGLFASLALRPAALKQIKFDFVSAAALCVFSLGLLICVDWFIRRHYFSGALAFNVRSLESEAVQIGAFLVCSAIAAHFLRDNKVSALLLFIALTAAKLLTILLEVSFSALPWRWLQTSDHEYLQLPLLLWFYLFTYVNLRRGLKLSAMQVAIVMVPLLLLQGFQERAKPHDFWREVRISKNSPNPASEDVLEKQASLLPTQLLAMSSERPGLRDVYFLGFAPFATEDVFKLELDAIVPMMEKRFDAVGRTLRLSNHLDTLTSYPFASLSNLRKALFAISTKMNPSEDIFVLYITSHGSRQHSIASRIPPIDFNEVTPKNLRAMLDASGIKNRVLIISACYSGGFIEPLKDANTLIMTAAAADKPSFGCGAESDFTYFGKAVMDEQLRINTTSFEQAFRNALPKIREKEKAQGFDDSKPQIHVGEQIAPILNALEKQLSTSSLIGK